jgi:hypothetical protein
VEGAVNDHQRLNDEQILAWNKFMEKCGWRDEDEGSTQEQDRLSK